MTFPFEALTSLSGTNITAKISLQLRFQGSFTVLWFGGQCLLLSASSFEQLPQLIQINAAFIWLQLCLPTFKFVCGGKTPSTTFQNISAQWTENLVQGVNSCNPITVKTLTLVDDHLLQLPLGRRPLQDLLVDGVGCDQAVHHYWFCLSYAVTAVLSLQVCLWVLERWQKHQTWTQWDMYKKQLL